MMNLEQIILDTVEALSTMDFNLVIRILGFGFLFFWLMVVGWVWGDVLERTKNWFIIFISVVLVLVFNVFGLLVYLLIRPKTTIEEVYWADLERRYLKYETFELKDCPECGYQLRPGFNICPKCGYTIRNECVNCGVAIDKGWEYCPFCKQKQMDIRLVDVDADADVKPHINEQSGRAIVSDLDSDSELKTDSEINSELKSETNDDALTSKEMAVVVEKTQKEVVDTVEKRKTRYAFRSGLLEQVRNKLLDIQDKNRVVTKHFRINGGRIVRKIRGFFEVISNKLASASDGSNRGNSKKTFKKNDNKHKKKSEKNGQTAMGWKGKKKKNKSRKVKKNKKKNKSRKVKKKKK